MGKRKRVMEISGSVLRLECEKRLINLYNESHQWLIQVARNVTKQNEEAECLCSELYEYLHLKCNQKIFWGNSYNIMYCSKFLKHRWINKTKKLNRTTYVEEIWDIELDIPYDEEGDRRLEETHIRVMEELKALQTTKMWPAERIFSLYFMSDRTLDKVAKDIGISKSTTFLAVKKIRRHLEKTIDNPFEEKEL
jgi:DNA-directed RNA polymerase specialized sigma24 family protein